MAAGPPEEAKKEEKSGIVTCFHALHIARQYILKAIKFHFNEMGKKPTKSLDYAFLLSELDLNFAFSCSIFFASSG